MYKWLLAQLSFGLCNHVAWHTEVFVHSSGQAQCCVHRVYASCYLLKNISGRRYYETVAVIAVCFSEALDTGISEAVTCWYHINNFLIIILNVCFWESSIFRLNSRLSKSKHFPIYFFFWFLFFFNKNRKRKSWWCPLVKHRVNMLLQLTPKSLGVKTSEISWAPVQKKTLAHP